MPPKARSKIAKKHGKVHVMGPASNKRAMIFALLSSLGFLLVVHSMPMPRPAGTPATTFTGLQPADAATPPP